MTPVPQPDPPHALLIYRDPLIAGREADFKVIEEDAARICAERDCPNAHLAIESLTAPKEVWWLTPFASEADRQRVYDGYAANTALTAALAGIAKRREGVTGPATEALTTYRADASGDAKWELAGARFVAVALNLTALPIDGSVFEAPDGTRFILRPAPTQHEAETIAAAWGPGARVFAVRPYWGMAAKEWIDADPEFWQLNPMAQRRRET